MMGIQNDISIRRINNGYIITFPIYEHMCLTLDECFEQLLLYFEGRAPTFTGELYGSVYVDRDTQPRVAIPRTDHNRVIRNPEYKNDGHDEETKTPSPTER